MHSQRSSSQDLAGSMDKGYQSNPGMNFQNSGGNDFNGWLFKCEQFFKVDEIPLDMKVKLAAMHFEGKALQWHQIFMKSKMSGDPPRWEEYVRTLASRFSDCIFDEPMGELMSLRLKGTIQAYREQFEELLSILELLENYTVSCFLSGLKEEIQLSVHIFLPKTLQHARTLAKLDKSKILNSFKKTEFL